jgi:5-methylcytosine-specific restriction endonuclease McrA
MYTHKCQSCEKVFQSKKEKAAFCSRPCYYRYYSGYKLQTIKCKSCDIEFNQKRYGHIHCSKVCSSKHREGYKQWGKPRLRGPFDCRNCGKSYFTRRPIGEGEQFCSKDCSYGYNKGINHPSYTTKSMSPLLRLYYKPCEWCGVLLRGSLKPRRYCSREHHLLWLRRYSYESSVKKKVLKSRPCIYCKKDFTPEYGNKRKSLCSDECARRFRQHKGGGSHRARAKRAGVTMKYFNVMRIFERDKWRCQLCGISTPKRLKGKNLPNSPELDHIIPLSQGGGHVIENVQCACRKCNGSKGNKPLGQLWLAGTMQYNQHVRLGAGHVRSLGV